jgi:hypothetical protein
VSIAGCLCFTAESFQFIPWLKVIPFEGREDLTPFLALGIEQDHDLILHRKYI